MAAGATAVITYGAKSGSSFTGAACGANSGATAPTTPGTYTFTAQERSTNNLTAAGGLLTDISGPPTVTVS
jgi:hypothetical protein